MKSEPAAQLRLLELQSIDAKLDQLRHQRGHLPELAEITTLTGSRDEVDGRRRDQQIVVDDLTAAQRKADVDVQAVTSRRTRDRDRMEQGTITSPKDLERMGQELESLERRISVLEDEELEIMEQLEGAQAALDELVQQVTAHDERLAAVVAARDEKSAVIDADIAAVSGGRGDAVTGLPDDLLALYEKLRVTKNGVGAAELRARRCTGCQIAIDHLEIGKIRVTEPDVVVRCEECSRILVRTDESGL